MIATDADTAFDALAARLQQQVAVLAEAAARSALLARADDPRRWRRAALLWPRLTKG